MIQHQLTTIVMAGSGVIGVVASGVALLAYLRFLHTSYSRMLLPLVAVTVTFTLAHGLVLLWPTHPLSVDILEPLSFTALVIGVVRLVQLHPRIAVSTEGDRS